MGDQPGTLDSLARAFGLALASVEGVLTPAGAALLFAQLGLDSPPDLTGDAGFTQSVASAADLAASLTADIAAVTGADGDDAAQAQAIAQLLEDIKRFTAALHDVASNIERATAQLPNAADLAQFAATFAERLLGAALVDYLETDHPFLRRILSLLTIVEITAVSVQVGQAPTTVLRKRLYLDRISRLINDPLSLLQDVYGWGSASFDGKLAFANSRDVFDTLLPIAVARDPDEDGPADLDLYGFLIQPATTISPPGIAGSLFADLPDQFDLTLGQLSDNVRLAVQVQKAFPAGLQLLLAPPANLEIPGLATIGGTIALILLGESQDQASAFTVLGADGGTRLQAVKISAGITGNLIWDANVSKANTDIGFQAEITNGELIISPPASDGFLSSVLPADGLQAQIDFGLSWSHDRGLTFRGAAGLDATFPLGLSVAGLSVPTLHLSLQAGDSGLQAEVSAAVGLSLGPIQALADRIGITATATFPQDGGNLGVTDVQLAFKPPSGIGLQVDAAEVTGGGFVGLDPASGRYSGALDLHWNNIGITAVGLLDTRLPAGESGYSLLLILHATFPASRSGSGSP